MWEAAVRLVRDGECTNQTDLLRRALRLRDKWGLSNRGWGDHRQEWLTAVQAQAAGMAANTDAYSTDADGSSGSSESEQSSDDDADARDADSGSAYCQNGGPDEHGRDAGGDATNGTARREKGWQPGLSDYEQQRLATIAKNQRKLAELGLAKPDTGDERWRAMDDGGETSDGGSESKTGGGNGTQDAAEARRAKAAPGRQLVSAPNGTYRHGGDFWERTVVAAPTHPSIRRLSAWASQERIKQGWKRGEWGAYNDVGAWATAALQTAITRMGGLDEWTYKLGPKLNGWHEEKVADGEFTRKVRRPGANRVLIRRTPKEEKKHRARMVAREELSNQAAKREAMIRRHVEKAADAALAAASETERWAKYWALTQALSDPDGEFVRNHHNVIQVSRSGMPKSTGPGLRPLFVSGIEGGGKLLNVGVGIDVHRVVPTRAWGVDRGGVALDVVVTDDSTKLRPQWGADHPYREVAEAMDKIPSVSASRDRRPTSALPEL